MRLRAAIFKQVNHAVTLPIGFQTAVLEPEDRFHLVDDAGIVSENTKVVRSLSGSPSSGG